MSLAGLVRSGDRPSFSERRRNKGVAGDTWGIILQVAAFFLLINTNILRMDLKRAAHQMRHQIPHPLSLSLSLSISLQHSRE
jgi:hypothetical protein